MDELLVLLLECEKNGEFHEDFRLWFTTEGHDDFPIALLQICIKFTNEPPAGMFLTYRKSYFYGLKYFYKIKRILKCLLCRPTPTMCRNF